MIFTKNLSGHNPTVSQGLSVLCMGHTPACHSVAIGFDSLNNHSIVKAT
jgi:hypothetical protein